MGDYEQEEQEWQERMLKRTAELAEIFSPCDLPQFDEDDEYVGQSENKNAGYGHDTDSGDNGGLVHLPMAS